MKQAYLHILILAVALTFLGMKTSCAEEFSASCKLACSSVGESVLHAGSPHPVAQPAYTADDDTMVRLFSPAIIMLIPVSFSSTPAKQQISGTLHYRKNNISVRSRPDKYQSVIFSLQTIN